MDYDFYETVLLDVLSASHFDESDVSGKELIRELARGYENELVQCGAEACMQMLCGCDLSDIRVSLLNHKEPTQKSAKDFHPGLGSVSNRHAGGGGNWFLNIDPNEKFPTHVEVDCGKKQLTECPLLALLLAPQLHDLSWLCSYEVRK